MKRGLLAAFAALMLAGLAGAVPSSSSSASGTQGYLVLLTGTQGTEGFTATGTEAAVSAAISAAGGTISNNLAEQIGVLYVHSPSSTFASALSSSALVESVGADFSWQGITAGAAPELQDDPLEPAQWDMQQIRTDEAHAIQGGISAVDVGVLDSGIDGNHVDFKKNGVSNVDCARGRNSVTFVPNGPGVGTADPCVDNQFHGTHVAGTIGARANGIGFVGVAPNVTLVPVKVCDTSGYCYASAVVDGITYAGDQKFDVINMSFFVDDNEFQQSTEFKCMDDPVQRTFRLAVERAIQYARNQGVTPVAALGNSDEDLAHPTDTENNCEVVPAETQGVIGTAALGRAKQKASYSNYGTGPTDVAAPGGTGTGNCLNAVPSTFPGSTYGCISGTSMASPHAAGVAALIVSQFGTLGSDGDVKMPPTKVEQYLQSTAVDQGLPGYDECFGNGRIDALRAVKHDTSRAYDASAPFCPEYEE
ncbi:MAG: S8 family serine peptidase [Actinomycetota bacterium]|nr:S8 family serine peptidase [Actinomycetota bacterium]